MKTAPSLPVARRFRPARAFSLVEMLVVLGIVGILTAISIPAIGGMMRAYQLDATTQTVVNQLNLARQKALSSSHAVQVRFYALPDYSQPAMGTPSVYRAMQCFTEGDPPASGALAVLPLTKPVFFPAPVVILGNTTPSPLLNQNNNVGDSANPLPTYLANYKYTVFRFKPDGSTDLTSATSGFTLALENDKIVANSLPANFQAIQIDPLIGTVRVFRP